MACLAVSASAQTETPHWSLTWKKLLMTGPELELVGSLPTRTTHELGASDWSIGCETLDRDYGNFDNYKPFLSELGVASARIQSGWARCEQKKGHYDFAWLDHIVDGMLEEGVQPWINLGYGNPVYGAEKSLGSKIFTDEPTMKAWLKFVETIVSRYRGKVHEWEIWNNPTSGRTERITTPTHRCCRTPSVRSAASSPTPSSSEWGSRACRWDTRNTSSTCSANADNSACSTM